MNYMMMVKDDIKNKNKEEDKKMETTTKPDTVTNLLRLLVENQRPNSFEFGKPGSRHKVYYETQDELQQKIKEAIESEQYMENLRQATGDDDGNNKKESTSSKLQSV